MSYWKNRLFFRLIKKLRRKQHYSFALLLGGQGVKSVFFVYLLQDLVKLCRIPNRGTPYVQIGNTASEFSDSQFF